MSLKAHGSSNGSYSALFLIDTGAPDSMAPASELAKIGVEPILGVTALESVGITIDPRSRILTRLPAIPLK